MLAGAACLFSSCHKHEANAETAPTPVRAVALATDINPTGLRYSASILPNAQVALLFKSGGYVEKISERKDSRGKARLIGPGDAVAKGEVLASVRQSDYEERVAQTEGQVAQAQAAFDKSSLDLARASNLFASESMPKTQFDAYRATHDANTALLKIAKVGCFESSIAFRPIVV